MQKQSAEFNQDEVSEVNVIPLADVCLVLVIIVMIFSPMALQSMIQVQSAHVVGQKAESTAASEKPLFIEVTSNGYMLNNNLIATEYALFRTLQKNLADKNDKTVLVTASADVPYESVVRILDIAKQSGAHSLSLVPHKKEAA